MAIWLFVPWAWWIDKHREMAPSADGVRQQPATF
jgi:hypothetical protein